MKIWNLTSLNGGDASEFDVIIRWILNEEPEFDVITDDDDDDEHSKVLLCSEKLSSAFNLNDDDDVLPIPKLNKDKEADVSVGRTGSTIMVAGWFYIPKLNDEELLGQDASFICAKEQTIGVADGINGGWSKRGIYSGEYSRELMKNSEFAVQNNDNSTTVDLMKQLGNASSSDDPSVAEKISVPVVAGDVIVLGTDGLFDNVHDFELETLVNSGVDSLESDVPEILAWRIALYALDNAKSTELYMPFSRECSKVDIEHHGGN
ncbi:putative uric acid degradation bifunctional protein TTL-like isoform X1 [Capsicum annuum]|nr:putative uric acid degradation bifunctional protein TTL-like isoform X1 [Capsicum annuum]